MSLKIAGASKNTLLVFPGVLGLWGVVFWVGVLLRKTAENCKMQRIVFPLDLTSNEENVAYDLSDL